MGLFDDVNVTVNGGGNPLSASKTYETVVLRPYTEDNIITLVQRMVETGNTKYVIKWNFDLRGREITIPAGCLLEFAGGSLSNGKLIGTNTVLIYECDDYDKVLKNVEMGGTWHYSDSDADGVTIVANNHGKLGVKDGSIGQSKLTGVAAVAFSGSYNDLINTPQHIQYIQAGTAFPSNPEVGEVFFHTTLNKLTVLKGFDTTDPEDPVAIWVDSDGNPADAKTSGLPREAPSGVKAGFQFFDDDNKMLVTWNTICWLHGDGFPAYVGSGNSTATILRSGDVAKRTQIGALMSGDGASKWKNFAFHCTADNKVYYYAGDTSNPYTWYDAMGNSVTDTPGT